MFWRGFSLPALSVRIDWSDESIATARHRLNEPRTVGGISQCFAQSRHRAVQPVVEVNECIGCPDLLALLVFRDNFPRVFKKDPENLKGLFLQLHSDAALA